MAINDSLTAGQSTTYSSGVDTRTPPDLRFIHYNDVYHVEPGSREPVGGIARFQTLCNYYRKDSRFANQPGLLTFFSGDAFNPSLESSVTKGKHMVNPLNNIGTDVACLGNHDLDFGVDQFRALANQCTFPWLCANVLDLSIDDGAPLAGCKSTVMLGSSNGIKIGVIGVVEREWLATINTLPPKIQYLSAGATVAKLAPQLRQDGAQIVIVLSHQRQPNDEKLANKLESGMIDIILGGHDHDYAHTVIEKNGIHILRSGTDFKQLSYLEARRKSDGKGWNFDITRRDVISSIEEEPSSLAMVDKITAALRPKLEKPIGYTCVPLDARFTTVRKEESNLGNFVCDLLRLHYQADCCIMAAGTIRGDQIYPPGVLRVKDIMDCFPFEDPCVVIECKGSQIVEALENAVATYPALEGRFPQVSNIQFTLDPSRQPGNRCSGIKIGNSSIEPTKDYKLATRDYMVRGKDGFTSLMLEGHGGTAKSIVSDENGLLISMILRQYFMSLKVLGRWRQFGPGMHQHWSKVQDDLHEVHPVRSTDQSAKASGKDKDGSQLHPLEEAQTHATGEARVKLVGRAQDHPSQPSTSNASSNKQPSAPTDTTSDSDSDEEPESAVSPDSGSVSDRKLHVMRKTMRKWCRLAGLEGQAKMGEEETEKFQVDWTKGIAPKLEGRIRILGTAPA